MISTDFPANGLCPVRDSYSITPKLYQSLASETRQTVCSGDVVERRPSPCLIVAVRSTFGHEAEVEQDDAIGPGHQHVGRLDIAVQLPGRVQRADSGRGLSEGRPQPDDVDAGGPVAVGRGRNVRFPGSIGRRFDGPRLLNGIHLCRRAFRVRPRRLRAFPDVVVEALPVHQLHREEPVPAVGKQLIESRQVGVRDVREGPEFAL
jgi:hypothetical protein